MLSQRGLSAAKLALRPNKTSRALHNTTRRASAHKPEDIQLVGAADNAFNRERLAVKKHAQETSDFWRRLSIYIVIPALVLGVANTWVQWNEHWEHQAHMPPLAERPQYAYMNLRTRAYPWGDGNKTLFWNDKYNYYKKDGE